MSKPNTRENSPLISRAPSRASLKSILKGSQPNSRAQSPVGESEHLEKEPFETASCEFLYKSLRRIEKRVNLTDRKVDQINQNIPIIYKKIKENHTKITSDIEAGRKARQTKQRQYNGACCCVIFLLILIIAIVLFLGVGGYIK